jgi:hypothetical protein
VGELFATFPERIYRPVVDEPVRVLGTMGWGGSEAPAISSVSLHFQVGRGHERIEVSVATRGSTRRWDAAPLLHLVGELVRSGRSPGFPLVIERGKQRIRVDGQERVFTIYTASHAAVAVARFGQLQLSLQCRRSRLATIALVRLEPEALTEAMSLSPTPPR